MQALRYAIAVLVTIVWCGTYGKYLAVGGASPPAEVSGLMLLVVTWALGAEAKDAFQRRRDG